LQPLTCRAVFETGTYLVTDTIFVPAGTKIVGNLYAVIMGSGPNFADQKNPRPVIQVLPLRREKSVCGH
jgi:hypothetical protein